MKTAGATNWYDFGGLAGLRAEAADQPHKANSEISKQFESLFLNLMLKEMRKGIPKGELLGSDAMESYQQMFDQQVSLGIARAGGIGIAKFIDAQLNRPLGQSAANSPIELSTTEALKTRSVSFEAREDG